MLFIKSVYLIKLIINYNLLKVFLNISKFNLTLLLTLINRF